MHLDRSSVIPCAFASKGMKLTSKPLKREKQNLEECIPKEIIMTRVPAIVLSADKLGDQYLITVQVQSEKCQRAFDELSFGENTPHFGSYQRGWLDLVYHRNPGLKRGQPFPLWVVD